MPANTLPVLILSAKETTQAILLATELMNNKDATELNGSVQEHFVWRLQNKYYSANVRILPVGDDDRIENDVLSLAEAHIIYISKEEKDLVELAQKRVAIVNNTEVDINLLLYEGSETPSALAAWACNNHYEVIPLEETASPHSDEEEDDDPEGPFKETYGIERARDTLHAHMWTGLQRIDIPAQIQSFDGLTLSSEDEWVGQEDEEENFNEEEMVERAEAFAMALESVLDAQASRGEGDDEVRRRRAEGAVNALRRALGPDFDWL